ncbi:MAG: DUF1801 domain-containing protein [Chloroflexota bacterium]
MAATTKQTDARADDAGGSGFTAEEKAAMRERAKELKAAKRKGGKADGEADVLAKLAEMPAADRVIAERLHAIVKANAPSLEPRTWYGMPGYALDGKVLCFFKAASKFGSRYAELGFNDNARLDDGAMWPTVYAVTELTPENERRITELVRRCVG